MAKDSLIKSALLKVIKLSILYSLILITAITLIALYFHNDSKITEINNTIISFSNSMHRTVIAENIPAFLEELQHRTNLQEIAITENGCQLLASTSLGFPQPRCENDKGTISVTANINSRLVNIIYKLNYNFLFFLKKNSNQFIILFIFLFFTTFFFLVTFSQISFLTPIRRMQDSLKNESNSTGLPIEFNIIDKQLNELRDTIRASEKDKTYYELARRVVHDIRNPILYLKSISHAYPQEENFNEVLNEIDYQINNLLGSTLEASSINLESFFRSVKNELQTIFPLNIEIQNSISLLKIQIHPYELKNIISNLTRNSFEANATRLKISTRINNEFLDINISDNGEGIPSFYLGKIFNESFTTKENGNGIGLNSIYQFLKSKGGLIQVSNNDSTGAAFKIAIPLSKNHSTSEAILIDDDKFTHIAWKKLAKENSISINTFFSVEEFITNCSSFSKETHVYIDSQLGDDLKGESLSVDIFNAGFKNIFLATSYDDINIESFPWIKGSVSKRNPFS